MTGTETPHIRGTIEPYVREGSRIRGTMTLSLFGVSFMVALTFIAFRSGVSSARELLAERLSARQTALEERRFH